MRRNPITRENFINVLLPTNEHTPLKLEHEDRRINVTPRQEVPVRSVLSDHDIDVNIKAELMQLSSY